MHAAPCFFNFIYLLSVVFCIGFLSLPAHAGSYLSPPPHPPYLIYTCDCRLTATTSISLSFSRAPPLFFPLHRFLSCAFPWGKEDVFSHLADFTADWQLVAALLRLPAAPPPHQKRINPPYFEANTHRHEVINSELLHKEKESQLLIPSRLMLKIYSSCRVFGSCLFSVGVGNNNVVNFLFFPFELSSCMRNNFLVSAAAGEKCDTDITLPRYDSPEISAYSSNQNSDPLLTSACVAPRRSAEPQSTCVIWSGQWCRWFEGRLLFFFFFCLSVSKIRRLSITTHRGAVIQQHVLIRPLRSTFPGPEHVCC